MNYSEKFDLWFNRVTVRFLASGNTAAFKKAVWGKVAESYRNGLRAGRAKKAPKPSTTSKQD